MADQNQHKTQEERAKEWLESSGTALELRVAREFRRLFGYTRHSYHYSVGNADTREIDVVSRYQRAGDYDGHPTSRTIASVVECKSTKGPWVLYRKDPSHYWRNDDDLLNMYRLVGNFRPEEASVGGLHNGPLFMPRATTVYDGSDTDSNNKLLYGAIRQTESAIQGLLPESHASLIDTSYDVTVHVPVIVTTSTLFEVYFNGNGDIMTEEVNFSLMIRPSTDAFSEGSAIWILNESAVPAYVEWMKKSVDNMFIQ